MELHEFRQATGTGLWKALEGTVKTLLCLWMKWEVIRGF